MFAYDEVVRGHLCFGIALAILLSNVLRIILFPKFMIITLRSFCKLHNYSLIYEYVDIIFTVWELMSVALPSSCRAV